jgi:hypothetical protein
MLLAIIIIPCSVPVRRPERAAGRRSRAVPSRRVEETEWVAAWQDGIRAAPTGISPAAGAKRFAAHERDE